jgi:hypothetical protein
MERALPILLLCASLALAGCGGEKPRVTSAPLPAVTSNQPPVKIETISRPVPEPAVMHLPGLDGVIGANASLLLREFGTPRIDLKEGDVRKLQFSGTPCVLDIYLYPPETGGDAVATHVEARRSSDGQDVDRAACVQALRKS